MADTLADAKNRNRLIISCGQSGWEDSTLCKTL